MSEIEKMYENAGIEKEKKQQCVKSYRTENGIGICIDFNKRDDYLYCYPSFTAEKQINMILFLANREIRISPTYISSGYYLNNLHKIKSSRNISTFENSLAQHINAIWQDLTLEEKQQVKGILE